EVDAPRTIQLWTMMLDWLGFLFQIFAQIVRSAPSIGQVLSYVGVRPVSFIPPSTPQVQFKPIPVVEIEEIGDLEPRSAPPRLSSVPSADQGKGGGVGAPLEKLMVVLDLDETLVCAYETSSLPDTLRNQATEAGINWFELECVSSDKEINGKPKINYVTVFERPGMKDFLKQLSEYADLVLFTAGLEGYARPLVDRIDASNLFTQRLYRPSTVTTPYRDHVKDLSCLSKDLSRIVIVDNNPFSFLLQPSNGIPCVPFSAAQPRDDQLMEVILPLLKQLSVQRDVRPVLYDKFRMPEWFKKHGIPDPG
ncbi:hypothetical protein M569_01780, partial [Genlisea aurea]